MSDDRPRPIDPLVTDAVTQANVKVLGDAPALALSQLYQTVGHQSVESALAELDDGARAQVAQQILKIYADACRPPPGTLEEVIAMLEASRA